MAKENMSAIQCGTCDVLIPLLNQYPVNNVPTFEYHCTSCNGKVHLQIVKGTDGRAVAKQIRLTNSPDEFRPNPIRPHHQVKIPVAYTLGGAKSTQHVKVPPLRHPDPAYILGRRRQPQRLPANDPMHPDQIRKRIQPQRFG